MQTRDTRSQQAKQTVAILETGYYTSPGGKRVDISDAMKGAKRQTVIYSPERRPVGAPVPPRATEIEVRNETTFGGLQRLASQGGHIGCLNFASARNPGGGFLGGAQAQEEALARASGLYACLLAAPEYYERNRANRSAIYLDLAIYSPLVPFFRDDSGLLLEQPVLASVITAPAPNAGAVAANEPRNLSQVEPALRRRAELVLAIAAAHKIDRLVLGAWGCGVFRNDPALVAKIFAELLDAKFANRFEQILFSVFDRTEGQGTYHAFSERLKSK
jgi:uncharacterized protein (TIGR02452 family)